MRSLRNARLLGAIAALFLIPNALFAAYLTVLPMAAVLAGCAAVVALAATQPPSPGGSFLAEPIDGARLAVCAAAAMTLLLLAGGGHLLYANWDWLFRDAVLADLGRARDLPRYAVDGGTFLLRAPIGMYLVPALAARLAGLGASHVVLLAQNTCLLTGILYLVACMGKARWGVVLLVFIVFSGMDIVGLAVWRTALGRPLSLDTLPSQIENWTSFYQYSSHVTQLFWVPNHCLPGWWLALLALLCVRREIEVGTLGVSLAACLLWSPLAVAGALPLAAVALLTRLRETLGNLRFWASAVAALGFLPVAVYLVSDAAQVPHELLLGTAKFWFVAPEFLIAEIPQAAIALWAWRTIDVGLRRLLLPAIAILIALPMFRIGVNNDLVMRGSIPALAILALASGEVLAQGWRPNPFRFGLAAVVSALGAVTPAFEIVRPFVLSRYAVSDCNLVTAGKQAAPGEALTNYLARPDHMPSGLLKPPSDGEPLTHGTASCWPDYPVDPTLGVWEHSNRELETLERKRSDAKALR